MKSNNKSDIIQVQASLWTIGPTLIVFRTRYQELYYLANYIENNRLRIIMITLVTPRRCLKPDGQLAFLLNCGTSFICVAFFLRTRKPNLLPDWLRIFVGVQSPQFPITSRRVRLVWNHISQKHLIFF